MTAPKQSSYHSMITRHNLMRQNQLLVRLHRSNLPVAATVAMADTKTSVLCNSGDSVCLLKTAVSRVVSNTSSSTANVLFDEGAQHSFISKS